MLHYQVVDPQMPAKLCVIWLHGLGASGADMMGLASHPLFTPLPLRHVFIDASVRSVTVNAGMMMPAWYDIFDFPSKDREDDAGIVQSEAEIVAVVQTQLNAGFRADQIILAGFSQGGAMALYTALQISQPLAGVIALSSYLPSATKIKPTLKKETPIFIASGQFDPIILPQWSKLSEQWLSLNGYIHVNFKSYPMEHTTCAEEINDIVNWLLARIREVSSL